MATPRTCMVRSGRAAAYSSSHRRRGLPRGCFRFIVSMARLTKKKGCYAHYSLGRSLRQTTPRDLACCCSPAATLMALVKVAAWIPNWRKASIHPPGGPEVSLARLVRMMMAVDAVVARRILCASPQDGSSLAAIEGSQDLA